MKSKNLIDIFFNPTHVALIGAKKRAFGFGSTLPRFLLDLGLGPERLHLVNPNEKEIEGLPVYPTVNEIPADVDMAIVIVPAPAVLSVLEQCGEKGVKAVNVQSAGFAETGAEGEEAQKEIGRIAKKWGFRVIGPNCVGVVNVPDRFSTCAVPMDEITPGRISIAAQSGVFGNILTDWAPSQALALGKLASIGNRADVDECDMLEYLGEDPETDVIVMYLESVSNGRRFLDVARKASLAKPVLVYKSGETEAGKQATMSHTGSLSGADAVFDGVCRQAGITRAGDLVELFDMARAFAACPLPKGRRAAVVTGSGSQGAIAADRLVQNDMVMARLSDESVAEMKENAPDWMNVGNPLDVGPSGLFAVGMKVVLNDPGVDGVIIVPIIPWTVMKPLVEDGALETARDMFVDPAVLERAKERTLLVTLLGHRDWLEIVRRLFGPHAPLMSTPHIAARAMSAMASYREWRERSSVTSLHSLGVATSLQRYTSR
jgi:acetyltransferase